MGNKRNKRNSKLNTHRHVFSRRRFDSKWKRATAKEKQQIKIPKVTTLQLEGSRIIDIQNLQQYTNDVHSAACEGSLQLNTERRNGMASVLSGECSTCKQRVTLETSKKVKGPRGYSRWESNLAAVWGQMSTGGGHRQLEETMAVMGVPVMTTNSFISTERDLGQVWKQTLQESMIDAGREERRLAVERGDYHEGVPSITVIVDGGWSKRSHRHSYNANSGVGIIIGKETGKILFIGVRNKFCTACSRGISLEKHICFKNWDQSSSEMETDIILEGFLEAEKTHGVRYTRFVGDGDSSVYPTLLQNVPGWGYAIKKMECANHACKCYRSSLEKLVKEHPSYKGSGGLTLKMRKRLVSAARCAIRMRSNEQDKKKALAALKKDLENGPRHCFGNHKFCSPEFCKTIREHQISSSNHPSTQQPSTGAIQIQSSSLCNHSFASNPSSSDLSSQSVSSATPTLIAASSTSPSSSQTKENDFRRENGHPGITVQRCGLHISEQNNWLAATPDGLVIDPDTIDYQSGLLEIKNPYSVRDKTLDEACSISSFCLEFLQSFL